MKRIDFSLLDYSFLLLLCVISISTVKSQETTVPEDPDSSGEGDFDSTTAPLPDETTTSEFEDLFSTSTAFAESSSAAALNIFQTTTTSSDETTATVRELSTTSTSEELATSAAILNPLTTVPLSEIDDDDEDSTTTAQPRIGDTTVSSNPTTGSSGQDFTTSAGISNALTTVPLSEIDDDDEDSSTTAQSVIDDTTVSTNPTTSSSGQDLTTTSVRAAEPITTFAEPVDVTSGSVGPDATSITTTGRSSSSTTPTRVTLKQDCSADQDCDSNQHCVSRNSTTECVCKPGYWISESGLCIEKVKHFGGKITFDTIDNIETVDPTPRQIAEGLVTDIFSSQAWIRSIDILSVTDDPVSVLYELITNDEPNINSSFIQNIFDDSLPSSPSFDNGCACDQVECRIEDLLLLAEVTCQESGQVENVLCDNSVGISQYCDDTSTTCTASNEGRISCPCRNGFTFNTDNSCIETVCSSDTDCNAPHGYCDTSSAAGSCSCNWGFSGSNCGEPWLLVMTVVISVIVAAILAFVTYMIIRRKVKSQIKPVTNKHEALSREPKYGYRKTNENYNASPWENDRPVRPTAFNQVEPAENENLIQGTPDAQSGNTSLVREDTNIMPNEAQLTRIRNIARARLSARRQILAPQEMDFVLPNQIS